MNRNAEAPLISVVVPCYNEQEVIGALQERLRDVLSKITGSFEIIFVDDGSNDCTGQLIRNFTTADKRIKLIEFSRNFGKEIAMSAGIDFARGDAVVVIDADLQDPPELISELVAKWQEGFDVVYATRVVREGEGIVKRVTARAFYMIIGRLSKVNIPENTGDFRLLSKRAVEALSRVRERHRFMKGLFSWIGFRQIGVPYRREPRFAGTTKWNYWKLWNFAIEGITSFSIGPLQISTYFGILTAFFAFLYAGFLIIRTLIFGIDLPGYPSIMVTVLFFGGVQLISLGVIGEYLGRLFNEAKKRPLYLVSDMVGFSVDSLTRHGTDSTKAFEP